MELCSLEDAFPNIQTGSPFVGGKDAYSSKEERRAARKKAKRCKAMAPSVAMYQSFASVDPDRPAVVRAEEIPPFQIGGASSQIQETRGGQEEEGFRTPQLPGSSCLFSDPGYPEYFGKDEEDVEEGFSSYSRLAGDNPNYVLQPDLLSGAFDGKGVDKASGGGSGTGAISGPHLPAPNMNDVWKPLTESGTPTSFLPNSISAMPGWLLGAADAQKPKEPEHTATTITHEETKSKLLPLPPAFLGEAEKRELLSRIEELQRQLKAVETEKAKAHKMSQGETLVIVGGGIGILMALDILCYLS